MPLIILGLLVVIGIVLYSLVKYGQNEDTDTRTVRERYPHVFEKVDQTFDKMKHNAGYTVIDDGYGNSADDAAKSSDDDHTLHFPDNAEMEKRKRNIH